VTKSAATPALTVWTPGANVTKLFSLSLVFQQNKLECLLQAVLLSLVLYLKLRPGANRRRCKVADMLTNIRLDWKSLPSKNTLAYFPSLSLVLWQNKLECLLLAVILSLVLYLQVRPGANLLSGAGVSSGYTYKYCQSLPWKNTLAYFPSLSGIQKKIITLTTELHITLFVT